MKMIVHPSNSLRGSLALPGDKSLSHRAVLFAAIAQGSSHIRYLQVSGVTKRMLEAVRLLGLEWELGGTDLVLNSPGISGWSAPKNSIDCGSSATTLRLLAGALAASGLPAVLDGSEGLKTRPMDRILLPLQGMDVPIHGIEERYAPLTIGTRPPGQKLRRIDYALPVASAQVKSCLLLAGLDAEGPLTLHEPAPSRDHTERMLQHMGVQVETFNDGNGPGRTIVLQPPSAPLSPLQLDLPGDLSSAAFLIVAALIVPGSEVTVRNVGLNPGRTGLLDTLLEMGADLQVRHRGEGAGEPYGDITARYSTLKPALVSGERVVRMIDEFPIFAVAAAFAGGKTVVKDAEELRYKESDRIACLCQELSALGCCITETLDGFVVEGPANIRQAAIDPHGDHRLAMALAVAGLAGNGLVEIQDAQIVNESYPEFSQHLSELGARLHLEEERS